MPNCSVAECKNWRGIKPQGSSIVYHRYPRDPVLAKLWVIKTKRKDKVNVKNAQICSDHFLSTDYFPNGEIKPGTIPSVFKNRKPEVAAVADNGRGHGIVTVTVEGRSEHFKKRKQQLIQNSEIVECCQFSTNPMDLGIRIDAVTTMKMEILDLRQRIERQTKIITDHKEEILKYKNLILNQKSSLYSIAQRKAPQNTTNTFTNFIQHHKSIENCFKKDLIISIRKLPELTGKVSNQLFEDFNSKKSNYNPTQIQIHSHESFFIANLKTVIFDLGQRIERKSKIISDQKEELQKYKNLIQKSLDSTAQRKAPQKTSTNFSNYTQRESQSPSTIKNCFNKVLNKLFEDPDSTKSNPNSTQIDSQDQDFFSISNTSTTTTTQYLPNQQVDISHNKMIKSSPKLMFDKRVKIQGGKVVVYYSRSSSSSSKINSNQEIIKVEKLKKLKLINDYSPIFIENSMQKDLDITTKNFKCEYCNKAFSSIENFNFHARIDHKKMTDIKCSTCGLVCPSFQVYEMHMNVHWGKFKCSFCDDKSFGKKYLLNRHIRNCHIAKKENKCGQCGQVIFSKSNLARHIRTIHQKAENQTFHCSQCPKTFARLDNLKLHEEIHNSHKTSLECSTCHKIYNTTGSLWQHIYKAHRNHNRKYKPNKAGRTSQSQSIAKFKCPYESCNRDFILKAQLNIHILRIHERDRARDFKCNFEGCEWSFLTKSELQGHTSRVHTSFEERTAAKLKTDDYICSLCGASLRYFTGFRKHMKNHQNENNTGEFACELEGCWRKFDNLFALKAHKRHHFKQNPKMYNTSQILSKRMFERKNEDKNIKN